MLLCVGGALLSHNHLISPVKWKKETRVEVWCSRGSWVQLPSLHFRWWPQPDVRLFVNPSFQPEFIQHRTDCVLGRVHLFGDESRIGRFCIRGRCALWSLVRAGRRLGDSAPVTCGTTLPCLQSLSHSRRHGCQGACVFLSLHIFTNPLLPSKLSHSAPGRKEREKPLSVDISKQCQSAAGDFYCLMPSLPVLDVIFTGLRLSCFLTRTFLL